ncbi:MAG: antitoxin [Acidobacteria bacterium]|nr:MAG: antitoxin [Acidobacteriota bacterium]
MRTTVTLDPDVEVLLRKLMRQRGLSFKAALNQAVRQGLVKAPAREPRRYRLKTFRMGYRPEIGIDKALSLASALEDEEITRKLSVRK